MHSLLVWGFLWDTTLIQNYEYDWTERCSLAEIFHISVRRTCCPSLCWWSLTESRDSVCPPHDVRIKSITLIYDIFQRRMGAMMMYYNSFGCFSRKTHFFLLCIIIVWGKQKKVCSQINDHQQNVHNDVQLWMKQLFCWVKLTELVYLLCVN